jgi:hypothetical protein
MVSAPVFAQQSDGPAFSFSDLSLDHADVKVYSVNNGSMMYITTINTSSNFIYDPTANYVFVFEPTLSNTYGSSPEGVIAYIQNNPELSAIVLVLIIAGLSIAIYLLFIRRS